ASGVFRVEVLEPLDDLLQPLKLLFGEALQELVAFVLSVDHSIGQRARFAEPIGLVGAQWKQQKFLCAPSSLASAGAQPLELDGLLGGGLQSHRTLESADVVGLGLGSRSGGASAAMMASSTVLLGRPMSCAHRAHGASRP